MINTKVGIVIAINFPSFAALSLAAIQDVKAIIGYVFLGFALILAAFAYAYLFIMGKRWKKEEEERKQRKQMLAFGLAIISMI